MPGPGGINGSLSTNPFNATCQFSKRCVLCSLWLRTFSLVISPISGQDPTSPSVNQPLFKISLNKRCAGSLRLLLLPHQILKMSNRTAGLLFLMIYVPLVSAAQSAFDVSGRIIDERGQPLPGITIRIQNDRNTGTVTDTEGYYMFKSLVPGTYTLIISGIGLQSQQKTIVLDQDLILNATLQSDTYELDAVQVEGSQSQLLKESGLAIEILETEPHKNLSTDLNQLLKNTPGIIIRETGGLGSGFKLSLNGLSGNQIRYFIDGVPMENFGSSMSLNNFPVNTIESIEVYKGVVPITLGADALGGAINLISAHRRKSFLDAAYTYGSFNTHRPSLNGQYYNAAGNYFFRFTSFYNHSDNNYRMKSVPLYDLELGNYQGDITTRRFHSAYSSGMVKAEVGLLDRTVADELSLGITYSANDNQFQHPDNNIIRSFGRFSTEGSAALVSANYLKKFGALKLRGYALGGEIRSAVADTSIYKFNWAGESIRRPDNDPKGELLERRSLLKLRDRILRTNILASYDFSAQQQLTASFSRNSLKRTGEDEVDLFNIRFESPNKIDKDVLGLSYSMFSKEEKWEATAFAKEYWFRGRIFTLDEQDRRIEHTLQNRHFGFGGNFSLRLRQGLKLKTSFEKAYRLPESYEVLGDGIYVNANAALQPEKSYNANLGIQYNGTSGKLKVASETNLFVRSSRDFIRFKPLGPFGQYENLSNVGTIGIETGVTTTFERLITVNLNGTYQHITDRTAEDEGLPNVNYKSRIPNIPYLFANARVGVRPFSWDKADFSFYWNTRYVNEFFLNWEKLGSTDSKHIIPRQLSHDVELECALMDGRYNASFTLSNLTDAALYDNFRIQRPGRALYVKLRYFIN